jgi:uncharacterized protein with HEPN domain
MAIQLIEDFTKDINCFTDYERDRKTQSAVERQLVIIGEALNQFKKLEQPTVIEHDRQIVSFRNRLVHAYDSIDNSVVWSILVRHLQPLKSEVNSITR